MPLQYTDGRERWKIFARADVRELKRRERRAPPQPERDLQVASTSKLQGTLEFLNGFLTLVR